MSSPACSASPIMNKLQSPALHPLVPEHEKARLQNEAGHRLERSRRDAHEPNHRA